MTDPAEAARQPSPQDGGEHVHRIRVRYAETDRMGVAHHGSYAAWFEEARTEWLRARGRTYRDMEDHGFLLQVVELVVRYKRPVTYDDEIDVTTRVGEVTHATVTLEYEVHTTGGKLVATGATRLACVTKLGRPQRLPPELRKR